MLVPILSPFFFYFFFKLLCMPTVASHSLLIVLPVGFQKLNFFHDLQGLLRIFVDFSVAFDPYA